MTTARKLMATMITLFTVGGAHAAITVQMQAVDANGQAQNIGTVTFEKSKQCGVVITPNLHDLTPGTHGFHIHAKPSCADKAMAAGGHYDPANTGKHLGPYDDNGHLGDLPILVVSKAGDANTPTLAPRLSMNDLAGRALMIHAGGDNYSDTPEKLGGGGARIACGVIK